MGEERGRGMRSEEERGSDGGPAQRLRMRGPGLLADRNSDGQETRQVGVLLL